jgi:iron complex outermembrane receptor protein
VQLTRVNALEGKFYNLERLEMLKGPQGTLYGRGYTAGSLSMVSRRPDIGQFGGNIQVEYGSFDRRRIEGALNIPAIDKLALRLSGRSVKRGAYDDTSGSITGNMLVFGSKSEIKSLTKGIFYDIF